MTNSSGDTPDKGLSITDIDSQRTAEERSREGKSGAIEYEIVYEKDNEKAIKKGKVSEIGRINESGRIELQPIKNDIYTHYAVFRLQDRSTTIVIQDERGSLYKIFSLGKSTTKVSHPVTIRTI